MFGFVMKDTMAEYAAVRDGGAGLIDLSSRGRIQIGGSEAVMFLNGLITNDVKALAEHRWIPAVFPTVQGRLIGAVRIARLQGGLLMDTDPASHDAVVKTVSRFTLAGDFKVTDVTTETKLLTVQGEAAAAVVEKALDRIVADLPRDGVAEIEWQDIPITIIRATHTAEDGFDLMIDSTHANRLQQALNDAGAVSADDDTFEILRVEAGIARHGRDLDETNVVIETNLDDAISYTKGCYIGQEIIVRIKHRGHVAKKLTGLLFDGTGQVGAGAIIKNADNKEIGKVTSTVFSPRLDRTIGLGYVRYEYLAAGTPVVVDQNHNATVAELPFVRGSWYQD